MKRIFRSSKSPQVDPFSPPESPASILQPEGSNLQYQTEKRHPTLFGGSADKNDVQSTNSHHNPKWSFGHHHKPDIVPYTADPGADATSVPAPVRVLGRKGTLKGGKVETGHPHEHKWGLGNRHRPEVTPFPANAESDSVPAPQASLDRRVSKKAGKSSAAPSMLEIKQMQEHERNRAQNQDDKSGQKRIPQPPPVKIAQRKSRGYQSSPSPDDWTFVSANGAVQDHEYLPQPLAVPNASLAQPHNKTKSSLADQSHDDQLPPGARALTSASNKSSYPLHMRYSQSNVQITTPISDDISSSSAKNGRDRGYSSPATSAVSQLDVHDSNSQNHLHNDAHIPQQVVHTAIGLPSEQLIMFPLSRPYTPSSDQAVPTANTASLGPSRRDSYPDESAVNSNKPFDFNTTAGKDLPSERKGKEEVPPEKEKEKKRFWQMGRTDRKTKEKSKGQLGTDHTVGHGQMQNSQSWPQADCRTSFDESRKSIGVWQETENNSTSAHGHSRDEEQSRGSRLLGLDLGGRRESNMGTSNITQVNDVSSAIRLLCGANDPSSAAIYEVCDRINMSNDYETIGKETARALRKEFKHGNEEERRNAIKVWLLMMRNVSKGFRSDDDIACASNKKFFQTLEPILFASPAKPMVSPSVHRLLTDVIADLTYTYGTEKGCEMLLEAWRKIKLPQEPECGRPLSADHPILNPDPSPLAPELANLQIRQPPDNQTHSSQTQVPSRLPRHDQSPYRGPGYTNLPSHLEDLKRLVEECTAAKESAKVLNDALVYTRPEELNHKPIIREFYQKVFHAHESLTNQMDWAQAEAARSRERYVNLAAEKMQSPDNATMESTLEEKALAALFDAHGVLADVMHQHDQLERLAEDEREFREVQERSKKETKIDRNALYQGLEPPPSHLQPSSSRSPSPTPSVPLPDTSRLLASNNPFAKLQNQFHSYKPCTSSPDMHTAMQLPKIPGSPVRTGSHFGAGKQKMGGPRPLPNPVKGFAGVKTSLSQTGSQTSLNTASGVTMETAPSGNGTGGSSLESGPQTDKDQEMDKDDLSKVPINPSQKALGKRRAVIDQDSEQSPIPRIWPPAVVDKYHLDDFDPNDLFNADPTDPRTRERDNGDDTSDESLLADTVYTSKPVVYAYDAYEEKLNELKRLKEGQRGAVGGRSG
nr:hypothetical protein L203_04486 [Cryptococcus depauperatus CBS 7841]